MEEHLEYEITTYSDGNVKIKAKKGFTALQLVKPFKTEFEAKQCLLDYLSERSFKPTVEQTFEYSGTLEEIANKLEAELSVKKK